MSPRLIMDGKSRRKFAKKLRRAGQREIGGVLFGEQLAPNEFKIIDFSVDSVTGSAAHFCRSPEHHNTALEGFFAKTGNDYRRYNYLGEWHSHPRFPVHPSNQDQHSMIELVHGERSIQFAVLLIVRLDWFCSLKASAFMFSRNHRPENILLEKE